MYVFQRLFNKSAFPPKSKEKMLRAVVLKSLTNTNRLGNLLNINEALKDAEKDLGRAGSLADDYHKVTISYREADLNQVL